MPMLSARSRPSSIRRGDPTSRAQRTPERCWSSPFASATASRTSVGSPPRSIQCEPPGRVRWLWPSTRPGTIVVPPASTHSQPAGRSPSSPVGRIQLILPPSARMLTPSRSRGDRPSAIAAPLYKTLPMAAPYAGCTACRLSGPGPLQFRPLPLVGVPAGETGVRALAAQQPGDRLPGGLVGGRVHHHPGAGDGEHGQAGGGHGQPLVRRVPEDLEVGSRARHLVL